MKRLSFADYILTLFFISMLVLAVGTFFYGVKIGKEKTVMKYEEMLKPKEAPPKLAAYDQQFLVSFYHTIFVPYRDFQKKWFEILDAIELQSNTVDPGSLFKELRKLADEKYKSIDTSTIPDTSYLLKEAQNNYLKSLKLFLDAIAKFQGLEQLNGKSLTQKIDKDPYFQEAKNFAILAQSNYYSAMEKWHETTNPGLPGANLLSNKTLNLKQWSQLSLTMKNEFTAEIFSAKKHFVSYYPQDLTIRIDDLIASGQAAKMKLTIINNIVEMLIDTGAVRQGDFTMSKNKFYVHETLPLLPFFFE